MKQEYWKVYFTEFGDYYHGVVVKADGMFEAMENVRNSRKYHCTCMDKAEPAQPWEIVQYNSQKGA